MKNKEEEKNIINNKDNIKKNKTVNNHEEITIRTNKYNSINTIIEVKLPNPYLDTMCVKYNKYIDYNIKSKYKSKYADYLTKSDSHNKRQKTTNKTFYSLYNIDQHIYFTKTNKKFEN